MNSGPDYALSAGTSLLAWARPACQAPTEGPHDEMGARDGLRRRYYGTLTQGFSAMPAECLRSSSGLAEWQDVLHARW